MRTHDYSDMILKYITCIAKMLALRRNSVQIRTDKLFRELFFAQYYYLSCGASEADFADRMGMSQVQLVDYVQNKYGLGFSALCDRNRVERFVDKIGDPKTENLTINTLIRASGFSNYESFARAVGETKYKDSLYKLQQF